MGKTASEKAEAAAKTFVKYTALPGIVSERIISKEDWASIGIEHETVTFDRSNRFMLDGSDFPDEVMAYFQEDPSFSVSGSDSAPRLADKGAHDNDDDSTGGGGSGLTGGVVGTGGSTATSTTGTTGGGTTTTT